jgi:CheY-like chemotaxis protein
VAVGSVANWIDQDQLRAGKTPGGHRRIMVQDLVTFLRERNLPVPAELVPARPRILIVDDELSVVRWIATEVAAERPDCEVLEAHDGFAAGQFVGTHRPDVVILDLRMPGMDGFEVCRRIKGDPLTRHATVIAMTAFFSPEAEKEIQECGAAACLNKPLEIDVLLQQMERALARRTEPQVRPGPGKGKQARGQS